MKTLAHMAVIAAFLPLAVSCLEKGVLDAPGTQDVQARNKLLREEPSADCQGNKAPPGSYQESLTSSIYYVNTRSIESLRERKREWFELCTDDAAEARAWSDATSENFSEQRAFVKFRENEKYFEFQKEGIAYRVHKCSYFDPSKVNRLDRERGPLIGTFNQRPIDATNSKELVEYLWFIWNYNFFGSCILSTETAESKDAIWVSLLERTVAGRDWSPARIDIQRVVAKVDKATGNVVAVTRSAMDQLSVSPRSNQEEADRFRRLRRSKSWPFHDP
ncbi:MAG: hypothetical protein V1790_16140 [Planctomycetota bacterium]